MFQNDFERSFGPETIYLYNNLLLKIHIFNSFMELKTIQTFIMKTVLLVVQ